MYSVRGRFQNGHTFSISPAPGADAKEALGFVLNSDEIKNFGSPITMVTVKTLSSKKRIRISDAPSKPRDRGNGGKSAAPAARKR